jgi:hypothetical protein
MRLRMPRRHKSIGNRNQQSAGITAGLGVRPPRPGSTARQVVFIMLLVTT